MPVAGLDVGEAVEGVGQRRADLGEQRQLVDGERRLAAARLRGRAGDADDVAEIEVDLARPARVAEKLDPAGAVDEVEEDELAVPPPPEHAAGEPPLVRPTRCPARATRTPRAHARDLVAVGKALRQHAASLVRAGSDADVLRLRRRYAALMSRILYFREPRGVATSTVSPFFLPMIALPTGDSFESFELGRVRLRRPDDVVLDRLLASTSRRRTFAPTETTLRSTSPVSITRALTQALLELGDPVLEHRLLVLRVVVLRVLGDVAELARDADPVRDLAALVGRQELDLLLQLLVSLGREDDFLHRSSSYGKSRRHTRRRGREW